MGITLVGSTGMGKFGIHGQRAREMCLDGKSSPLTSDAEDRRPMTLSLVEAKNVIVKDFSVIQPQFWYVK